VVCYRDSKCLHGLLLRLLLLETIRSLLSFESYRLDCLFKKIYRSHISVSLRHFVLVPCQDLQCFDQTCLWFDLFTKSCCSHIQVKLRSHLQHFARFWDLYHQNLLIISYSPIPFCISFETKRPR